MIIIKLFLKSYKKKKLNKTIKNLKIIMKLFNKNMKLLKFEKLQQKKKIFVVLKSPHVNKKAREHFIYKTYKYIITFKISSSYLILFNFILFLKNLLKNKNFESNIKIIKNSIF